MTQQARGLAQRALSGHGAIGLLAGGLLYLIALSGTLAVMHERWQRWEEPDAVELSAISPQAVQHALTTIIARQGKPTHHAYVHLPTEQLPRVVITTDNGAAYVDAAGRYDSPEAHVWTEFVLYLHYYLNLPPTLGLLVGGTIGVMTVVLAVSGIAAHPRVFRDAFRLRLRGRPQLGRTDLHNRLGVWLLPFIAAIGFTGAILGLGEVIFRAVADERHGGELEQTYAPLFGEEPIADPAPAPLARADKALAWMAVHLPDHRVTYVTIEGVGTKGQQIAILADHDRRLIYGETYIFDAQGRYRGPVGLAAGRPGQQAMASIYKLHFGDFAGISVELAYIVFGLGLCTITGTGMTLWLMKRRARGQPSPRLEAIWSMVIWGSPVALALAYWTRVVAGSHLPPALPFWTVVFLGLAGAMFWPGRMMAWRLRGVLGCATLLTGAVHMLAADHHPASSNIIDVVLMVGGCLLIWTAVQRFAGCLAGE